MKLLIIGFLLFLLNVQVQSQPSGCTNNICYTSYDGWNATITGNSYTDSYLYIDNYVEFGYGYMQVTEIGYFAFENCTSLYFVNIPNGVTTIGDYAFKDCTSLSSVNIPNGVTTIGDGAFAGCTTLPGITIPESVTHIGSSAFFDCAMSFFTLPSGVTTISRGTFESCDNLISVTIPNGVTSIEANAFSACRNLPSINIPSSVTSIGGNAFDLCTTFVAIDLPVGLTSIERAAFQRCINLESVVIPEKITSIEDFTFSACRNLESVTLPKGLKSIGNIAFSGCSKLASITLPAGIESFGSLDTLSAFTGEAFNNCTSLTSITNLNPVPVPINKNTFNDVDESACTLSVPYGSKTAYENAPVWKEFFINELPALTEINEIPAVGGVTINWRACEDATGYRITLYSDEAHTDSLRIIEFDALGTQNKDTTLRVASTLLTCDIAGLEDDTEYFYTFETLGLDTMSLEKQSSSFTTLLGNATSVLDATKDSLKVVAYYSVSGQLLSKEPESGLYIVLYDNGTSEKKRKLNIS